MAKWVFIVLNEHAHLNTRGVTGHFRHPHNRPWVRVDDFVTESSAKIVGAAHAKEVAIMNSLTANIHFMMVPFYRPTPTR